MLLSNMIAPPVAAQPEGSKPHKPVVVVSAVNLTEGGPLTVLQECLSAAGPLCDEWDIVALVHRVDLLDAPGVRLIAIPSAKKSWLRRLYWEWWGFHRLSRELEPALWLSLHDATPRVQAQRQAVYCHSPSPFYKLNLREAFQEPKFLVHNLLYFSLYRLLIRRNHSVIVQQEWLRQEFHRRLGPLPVTVAHPVVRLPKALPTSAAGSGPSVFFYPTLPRTFKNVETLLTAGELLRARGLSNFEIRLTMSGEENRYARWLKQGFGGLPQMKLIGRLNRDQMTQQYLRASAVVFPSKLETWGLPISEGKSFARPLLLADMPYAREAVGNYDLVSFFPVRSAEVLADQMASIIDGTWQPSGNRQARPTDPFAPDWQSLWELLTLGLGSARRKQA